MDFIAHLVFIFIGVLLGSFFGWMFMRRQWSDKPLVKQGEVGWLAALIAILLGASR